MTDWQQIINDKYLKEQDFEKHSKIIQLYKEEILELVKYGPGIKVYECILSLSNYVGKETYDRRLWVKLDEINKLVSDELKKYYNAQSTNEEKNN